MEKDWECVFRTNTAYLAEIAKVVLAEEGMVAVVIDKKDSSYHFGKLELYVDRKCVIKAKHLLRDFDQE